METFAPAVAPRTLSSVDARPLASKVMAGPPALCAAAAVAVIVNIANVATMVVRIIFGMWGGRWDRATASIR
jgi:hypothetical protein